VRVETADNEGALARMNLKAHHTVDSTSLIEILQYSLRAKDSKALMEFARCIYHSPHRLSSRTQTRLKY
jgi:hypothetical protein